MASMLASFTGVSLRPSLTQKRLKVQARRPLSVSAVTKKSPAPPPSRFGAAKAAPAAEKAALALVCGECGYVYAGPKAFSAQPASYKCPVCKAPKSAFSEKDTAGVNSLLPVIAAILLVAGGVGVYLSKL